MKLLLIADDERTASHLRKGLSEHGFVVDVSRDGEEGVQLLRQRAYDLLILDVLPGPDGWSLLGDLRSAASRAPVLFLSALDSVTDQVRELRPGADHLLVKPFALTELLVRIESILRRGPIQPEIVAVADLEVDLLRHRATRQGRRLDLTTGEFHLLAVLARRPGTVFSRTMIAERLWGTDFDGDDNVLDARVRRLRSKVDDPFEKKLIHTVRRLGYVLEERPVAAD